MKRLLRHNLICLLATGLVLAFAIIVPSMHMPSARAVGFDPVGLLLQPDDICGDEDHSGGDAPCPLCRLADSVALPGPTKCPSPNGDLRDLRPLYPPSVLRTGGGRAPYGSRAPPFT